MVMLNSFVVCVGEHNAVVFDLHKEHFRSCYVFAGIYTELIVSDVLKYILLFCNLTFMENLLFSDVIVAEFSLSRSGKT